MAQSRNGPQIIKKVNSIPFRILICAMVMVVTSSSFGVEKKKSPPAKSSVKSANPNANDIPCRRLEYKGRRDLPLNDLVEGFRKIPRPQLIQMAWDELYRSSRDAVTMPLLHYLSVNSPGKMEQEFFQGLGSLISQDWLPKNAIQQWPSRVPTQPLGAELGELCANYQKVKGK